MRIPDGPSVADAIVLPSLPKFDGAKVIEFTLIALIAKGVLRARKSKSLLRPENRLRLQVEPTASQEISEPEALIVKAVQAAKDDRLGPIVDGLYGTLGAVFVRIVQNYVAPRLAERGLAEARRERFLALIPVTRFYRTAAGEAERDRLAAAIEAARAIPNSSRMIQRAP